MVLLAIAFSASPAKAVAQTTANTVNPVNMSAQQVEEIQKKIIELQNFIKELQYSIKTLTGEEDKKTETTWCLDSKAERSLRYGDSGNIVGTLQVALEKSGFIISADEKERKFFGESTAAAVVGFQQKYKEEILTPIGLMYGTGFVGAKTWAKLNALYGCGKACAQVVTYATSPTGECEEFRTPCDVTDGWTPTDNSCVPKGAVCDQKCKDQGYVSGSCRSFAISPEGLQAQKEYEKTHSAIGYTSDCYLSVKQVGASKNCYCGPKKPQGSITLLYPNDGETLGIGKTYTIRWKTENTDETDNIYISLQNSARNHAEALALWVENTGSFEWTVSSLNIPPPDSSGEEGYWISVQSVPLMVSRSYIIRDYSDKMIKIVSDSKVCAQVVTYATYTPTVKCPEGVACAPGLQVCKEFPTPCDVPNGWTVTDKCRETPNEPEKPKPEKYIRLISPNGGESYKFGNKYTVKWETKGLGSKFVYPYLQFPDGGMCRLAVIDGKKSSFIFQPVLNQKCPNISRTIQPGKYFMAILSDESDPGFDGINSDRSDATFELSFPETSVRILYPQGGEIWNNGKTYNIKWVFSTNLNEDTDLNLYDKDKKLVVKITDLTGIKSSSRQKLMAKIIGLMGGNSYRWTVPADISPGSYRIGIRGQASGLEFFGELFTITKAKEVKKPPGEPEKPEKPEEPEKPEKPLPITVSASVVNNYTEFWKSGETPFVYQGDKLNINYGSGGEAKKCRVWFEGTQETKPDQFIRGIVPFGTDKVLPGSYGYGVRCFSQDDLDKGAMKDLKTTLGGESRGTVIIKSKGVTPPVSMTVNNNGTATSVKKGEAFTVKWTATNAAQCKAWFSGTNESQGGLASSGSKSFATTSVNPGSYLWAVRCFSAENVKNNQLSEGYGISTGNISVGVTQ